MRGERLSLRQRWRAHWARWWDQRLPRQDDLTLHQRNLYILPTRAGWSLAGVAIVLLLASINEQVNLGYALSFTLGGTALAALHQTHGNLQGIRLRLGGLQSVHAGEVLRVTVMLSQTPTGRGRMGLSVKVGDAAPVDTELPPGGETPVELDVPAPQRGWFQLPRVSIETRYPLGIFRAWAHWRPARTVLIWPALDRQAPPLPDLPTRAQGAEGEHSATPQGEIPEGLRDYRRGDPLKQVAWRKSAHSLAAGGGLVSREPATRRSPDRWLDFENSPGLLSLGTEARLSRLATWLVEAEREAQAQGTLYGLRLPGLETPCGAGPHHLRTCLDALGRWGQTS